MTHSNLPTLIQHRHDWIKSILKGTAILLLAFIMIGLGIYVGDLPILINLLLCGAFLALVVFIGIKIPNTRKHIKQSQTHLTITSGIWHKHSMTIVYTDIISIEIPHSIHNKPTPTVLNIYYYHNHQIHQATLPLFRYDNDILLQFNNFLYQLNFSHRLQNTQKPHPFPIVIHSNYGMIILGMVIMFLMIIAMALLLFLGILSFNELTFKAQMRTPVLAIFLIIAMRYFIKTLKHILQSGHMTLYQDKIVVCTLLNKETVLPLYLLNKENIETDTSPLNMLQKFYFKDAQTPFVLINNDAYVNVIEQFLKDGRIGFKH